MIYPYYMMMPGAKGQNVVHSCMVRHLNLRPDIHEKVAIYTVNQRIPNVYRIAGVAEQHSNSQASVVGKIPFDPSIIICRNEKIGKKNIDSALSF